MQQLMVYLKAFFLLEMGVRGQVGKITYAMAGEAVASVDVRTMGEGGSNSSLLGAYITIECPYSLCEKFAEIWKEI